MSGYFILDEDHNPVPVAGFEDFYVWLDAERERVGQELPVATLQVANDNWGERPDCVSTVFLGVNHNYDDGPPTLFETMLFTDDDRDQSMWRYSTWDEAVAGHASVVAALRNGTPLRE